MSRLAWLIGVWVGAGLVCAADRRAEAQGPQPQIAVGAPTTVQLPTFSVFTVQTTVSVPDRGSALLGGIQRGADGSIVRGAGPLRTRGAGSTRAASETSVGATVIDNSELDRAVLARAAESRSPADPSAVAAAGIARGVARSGTPVESIAAIRQRHAAAADERAAEVAQCLAKAQQAEAEGKTGVAKVFYQQVARHGPAPQKQYAEARLKSLGGKVSVAAR